MCFAFKFPIGIYNHSDFSIFFQLKIVILSLNSYCIEGWHFLPRRLLYGCLGVCVCDCKEWREKNVLTFVSFSLLPSFLFLIVRILLKKNNFIQKVFSISFVNFNSIQFSLHMKLKLKKRKENITTTQRYSIKWN